ncbi:type II restriction endonuclease [Aliarcobacter butzleri]|uniref:type II restriction endonuclease n=1 Tax=Aliarcobacter butzleri TaxID=28197 RepID=UPI001EDC8FFF|nr:type II restriction endonuclease [Aliarcobacter butzleri]MCG3662654.1 type II restriction endonuclease [Aliarcobacter butzleri]
MKYSQIFKDLIDKNNEEEVFQYLIETLKPSNRMWDYYVNWSKVFNNIEEIEIDLNTLNFIIGKEDIEEKLRILIKRQPSIIHTFPFLLAIREHKHIILDSYTSNGLVFKEFDLSKRSVLTEQDIEKAITFLKSSGFLKLLKEEKIKNLVDYVIGTEAGLDTNGRKNRSGHSMENLVEFFIKNICEKYNWKYLKEATAKSLLKEWNVVLPVNKSIRRLDFVIDNGTNIYLIETNFYGTEGSKLKSTAKEYEKMYKYWVDNGFKFIWITDGLGWNSAKLPLNEAFNNIDYILNLEMVLKDLLENILKDNL